MSCLRRLPRLPLSLHRSYSTNPSPSPYFVQTFGLASEQYLLLLPQVHLPLGRIVLSSLPPITSVSRDGPTPQIFHSIAPEEIKRDWATFVENAGFREVLQEVVRDNIAGEEMLVNEASGLPGGDGWIHLCDERSFPAFGRIPETEDIIGSVLVKGNKIQGDTYQPMPTYRLVTRDGPMKLSDFLLERLRERLRKMGRDAWR